MPYQSGKTFKLYTDIIKCTKTTCWDTLANTNNARDRKQARYQSLTEDIQRWRFKCVNLSFEIGVRGYIGPSNKDSIMFLSHTCGVRKPKHVLKQLGNLSLLGQEEPDLVSWPINDQLNVTSQIWKFMFILSYWYCNERVDESVKKWPWGWVKLTCS